MPPMISYQVLFADEADVGLLRHRWAGNEYAIISDAVRESLASGDELPSNIPTVDVLVSGKPLKLLDLRGINLMQLRIGDVDLSYCCFDHADFSQSSFQGTHLQYSTFNYATLAFTEWSRVQASPISADNAVFRNARIQGSFFMGSSLQKTDWTEAMVSETAFSGCDMRAANWPLAMSNVNDLLGTEFEPRPLREEPMVLQAPIVDSITYSKLMDKIRESRDHSKLMDKIVESHDRVKRAFDFPKLEPTTGYYNLRSQTSSRRLANDAYTVGVVTRKGKTWLEVDYSSAFLVLADKVVETPRNKLNAEKRRYTGFSRMTAEVGDLVKIIPATQSSKNDSLRLRKSSDKAKSKPPAPSILVVAKGANKNKTY